MLDIQETGQPSFLPPSPAIGYCNYTATTAPTNTNDLTEGYSVNSVWFDTVLERFYKCIDAAEGAAEWREILSATSPVDYNQITNFPTNRLAGRSSIGAGGVEAIQIGSGLSLSSGILSATGGMSIGDAIGGSPVANGILRADGSGNLANSANLTFASNILTVHNAKLSTPDTTSIFLSGTPSGSYSGSLNTFFGTYSGLNNTSGAGNAAFGYNSGGSLTTGNNNVFLGRGTGSSVTDGSGNVFIGLGAGGSNVSGSDNVFIGYLAGNSATGSNGLAIGKFAGQDLTTGSENTFVGVQAGGDTTTGTENSMFGTNAGRLNTTGSSNAFFGTNAGFTATGNGNVFLGNRAGYNETGSNKLYIENSTSSTPLIYGEFDNDLVRIYGNLYVRKTSGAQITAEYDGSNYFTTTVSSTGTVTLDTVGSVPKFIFADDVELNSGKTLKVGGTQFRGYTTSTGAVSTTELPNDKDWCFHYDSGAVERWLAINLGGKVYGVELLEV